MLESIINPILYILLPVLVIVGIFDFVNIVLKMIIKKKSLAIKIARYIVSILVMLGVACLMFFIFLKLYGAGYSGGGAEKEEVMFKFIIFTPLIWLVFRVIYFIVKKKR